MRIAELQKQLERKTARLAVVGLGYVGLPVACEFARAGFDVLGVEAQPERVRMISQGQSPMAGEEPGLRELLRETIRSGRLRATTDHRELGDRDVILICVETPVDEKHVPQYQALRLSLQALGPVMKDGTLVIIESTIAPTTMAEVVQPILEEASGRLVNQGFYLGNCPERVMPGKLLANLRSVSRVVGGMTPETADVMVALYRSIVQADLDPTDCITAEMVKTVENAYRDVQIAFANEVALICEGVGANVWKVRELVNKSPHRHMHLPGAGVGGHCIPKDPWLLAYGVSDTDIPVRLIPQAREINDSMPAHMAELVQRALECNGGEMNGAKILVMGYAYLEDSDDARNSPSQALFQRLTELGAEVILHDPYVQGYMGNVLEYAQGCDAAVLMVRHQEYLALDLGRLGAALKRPILVDGRAAFTPGQAAQAGLDYWGVGIAGRQPC